MLVNLQTEKLPVKGGGLPDKINLEVVWNFHRCSSTAPQLNGNLISIICTVSVKECKIKAAKNLSCP